MTPRTLVVAAGIAFVVGVGLMLGFDAGVTLGVGVALMFTYIVLGVFAIAAPDHLGPLDDEDDGTGS